ncbi:MAG: amidase [Acidiphilium sp.]
MATIDLTSYDATAIAQLIAERKISEAEVLDATLARIDALEPKLNAIAVDTRDRARSQLASPQAGKFAGVPFLLKDLAQDYAGIRMTMGSRATRNNVPTTNATYVDRCLAAGLVIVATTATPELGLKAITETALHGASRNPWNTERTPGGSSGGSGAAVAARYVPMAGASDGGGSIRIPAAFCGLFGLKPSRGRIPEGPAAGELWEGAVCSHTLTRSVRDSAAMLDCLAGPAPGEPFNIAPPLRPYSEEVGVDPGRLRIGFSTRSPIGGRVDAENITAVREAAKLLESLGHYVEEAEPAIDGKALAQSYMTMYFAHVAALMAQVMAQTGAPATDFETDTRALALLGRALSAGDFVTSVHGWNNYARALGAFHQRYDLFLTPTVAMAPSKIGELATPPAQERLAKIAIALRAGKLMLKSGIIDDLAFRNLERTPFTQLANLCFVPSMSVPLHHSAEGLPVGVMFTAKFGGEDILFRLAAQLEQAAPWEQRRPPI